MSSMNSNMQISNQIPVNLTGGPLSYRYRFHEIHIHYGLHDQFGSEHSVEGYTFPAEVNINKLSHVSSLFWRVFFWGWETLQNKNVNKEIFKANNFFNEISTLNYNLKKFN